MWRDAFLPLAVRLSRAYRRESSGDAACRDIVPQ
jgi:hypothetical protein